MSAMKNNRPQSSNSSLNNKRGLKLKPTIEEIMREKPTRWIDRPASSSSRSKIHFNKKDKKSDESADVLFEKKRTSQHFAPSSLTGGFSPAASMKKDVATTTPAARDFNNNNSFTEFGNLAASSCCSMPPSRSASILVPTMVASSEQQQQQSAQQKNNILFLPCGFASSFPFCLVYSEINALQSHFQRAGLVRVSELNGLFKSLRMPMVLNPESTEAVQFIKVRSRQDNPALKLENVLAICNEEKCLYLKECEGGDIRQAFRSCQQNDDADDEGGGKKCAGDTSSSVAPEAIQSACARYNLRLEGVLQLDKNLDGKVDFQEFQALFKRGGGASSAENPLQGNPSNTTTSTFRNQQVPSSLPLCYDYEVATSPHRHLNLLDVEEPVMKKLVAPNFSSSNAFLEYLRQIPPIENPSWMEGGDRPFSSDEAGGHPIFTGQTEQQAPPVGVSWNLVDQEQHTKKSGGGTKRGANASQQNPTAVQGSCSTTSVSATGNINNFSASGSNFGGVTSEKSKTQFATTANVVENDNNGEEDEQLHYYGKKFVDDFEEKYKEKMLTAKWSYEAHHLPKAIQNHYHFPEVDPSSNIKNRAKMMRRMSQAWNAASGGQGVGAPSAGMMTGGPPTTSSTRNNSTASGTSSASTSKKSVLLGDTDDELEEEENRRLKKLRKDDSGEVFHRLSVLHAQSATVSLLKLKKTLRELEKQK